MQLERIDGIVQFFHGTQQAWEAYDKPIPDGLMVYCVDTRIIKKGDGVHTFAELPVFLDLNKIDSLHILVQQLLPEIANFDEFSMSATASIAELQVRTLNFLTFIYSLINVLGLTLDGENEFSVTDAPFLKEITKTSVIIKNIVNDYTTQENAQTEILLVNNENPVTITLKPITNKIVIIKKIASNTEPINIQPTSGSIDLDTKLTITESLKSVILVSDGNDWWKIG